MDGISTSYAPAPEDKKTSGARGRLKLSISGGFGRSSASPTSVKEISALLEAGAGRGGSNLNSLGRKLVRSNRAASR